MFIPGEFCSLLLNALLDVGLIIPHNGIWGITILDHPHLSTANDLSKRFKPTFQQSGFSLDDVRRFFWGGHMFDPENHSLQRRQRLMGSKKKQLRGKSKHT